MPYYRLQLAQLGTAGLGTAIETDVLDRTGIPAGEAGLNWTRTLNAAGSLEFTLPLGDAFVTQANFAVGAREIHLYRDEVLVGGGRLWRAEVTSKVSVRFGVRGFGSTLLHREVDDDLVYNNVDQLQIAWNLIAFTQAKTGGALGITRGSATPSGVSRSISYCLDQRDVIADAIVDLAAAEDGFDFEVGPDKVFRTWHPLRGTTPGITLDDTVNVTDVTDIAFDASELANEVTGIKGGGNCETPVTELALDTGSRTTYGLMQSNVANSDVSAAHLAAIAADELRISAQPRLQPTVVMDNSLADLVAMPDLSDYDLGDKVTLKTSRGFATFDRLFRIVEIGVLARPLGLERITLKLDGVIT